METSYYHWLGGEVFGCIMWLWFFHRCKNDLPVLLGLRHPWEHAHDPFDISGEVEDDDQYDFSTNEPLLMDMEEIDEDDEDDDEDDDDEEGDDEEEGEDEDDDDDDDE